MRRIRALAVLIGYCSTAAAGMACESDILSSLRSSLESRDISTAQATLEAQQTDMDLYGREMLLLPFEDTNIDDFHRSVEWARGSVSPKQFTPYSINAIVQSNHRILPIKRLLEQLLFAYKDYTALQRGETLEALQNAELVEDRYTGVDLDTEILCPYLRAYRVRQYLCQQEEREHCYLFPPIDDGFAQIKEDSKARGSCVEERHASAEELLFTSVPLPAVDRQK